MILDDKVDVKISKKNIEYYSSLFKNLKLKDIVSINPINLQPNSNFKINVSCDICEVKRYIKYQAYNKNINSCEENKIYTCDKCSHVKIKIFNKKHYGVEYYSQHPERNEKVKKTSIEKYGTEHFSKSEQFKIKVGNTNLEKFGFINPFMDKDRIKSIFNSKWGVNHPSQVPEFKEKIENTNLERYGFKSHLKSKDIREKINNTNLIRYDGHYSKNENFRHLKSAISRDKDYVRYIKDGISLFKCSIGHEFEIENSQYHNRVRSKLPLCTICFPISENRSIKEIQLFSFIQEIYNGTIISTYRDGLEIDIYLPELKLGFEFNGLYWHSEEYKDKNYHLDKTNYFKERGIRIFHIWEDSWVDNSEIIKSQIRNILKCNVDRIFARKCVVKEVSDIKEVRNFLNMNHIQGYCSNNIKLGLYYEGILVAMMTFNKFEGRKRLIDSEWNLSRFCNKINTNIIGGASKMLNYFIKNYDVKRVISYADKDWSIGNLYYTLGFKSVSESNVDYKYIVEGVRRNKQSFKKSNLKIGKDITESEFMKLNGYSKVWDCGKIKFEYLV